MLDTPRNRQTIDEQLSAIGSALRDRRVLAAMTQEELAQRADISLGALQNLEHGRGSSVRTLLRVSRLLGSDQWVDALQPSPTPTVSPMQLLREQRGASKKTRVRRSGRPLTT